MVAVVIPHLVFYSPKGGVGTSVVAACAALTALPREWTVVIDAAPRHDMARVLGVHAAGKVVPGLSLEVHDDRPAMDSYPMSRVVVDVGTRYMDGFERLDGVQVMVLRPCYLALANALACPVRPDRIVLVEEPGRALDAVDVAKVLGVTDVVSLRWDPSISRCVDAGILTSRLPRVAVDALTPLL